MVAGSASSPSAPVAKPPCAIHWGDSESSTRSAGSACSSSYPNSVTSSAEVRITLVSGDGRKCLGGKCCGLQGRCSWPHVTPAATCVAGLLALLLIVAVALAIALPIAILQQRRGELDQAVQVRGAGPTNKQNPVNFSIFGRLQVAPSQASAPAKATTSMLCTAAASTTLFRDAAQNALASTVRSFGVEGVTVVVTDARCSKGTEVAFNVQLHCASTDPDLAAAVVQTLTGPAGMAAALGQLKRTTAGLFGEAGIVLLTQLRLEAMVGGSGSTGSSSGASNNAAVAPAGAATAGAGDTKARGAGAKASEAASSSSAANMASESADVGAGGGATQQGAQQAAVTGTSKEVAATAEGSAAG